MRKPVYPCLKPLGREIGAGVVDLGVIYLGGKWRWGTIRLRIGLKGGLKGERGIG